MNFEASSKYCTNAGVCAVLDRIGEYIKDEPPNVTAEKQSRAEAIAANSIEREAELEAAANPITADVKFRRAIESAQGNTRELAKRAAPFVTSTIDGRAIERIGDIIKDAPFEMFESIAAEFAREFDANPKAFKNPISCLGWRVQKAVKDAKRQKPAQDGRHGANALHEGARY